eukprot:TRINITY_DN4097_c0_g1_i1.p1 TRINITY_DN4097_c0_g1~~TRINITY_DN4097_c0_g1_i1.p1  ORF type:complete len:252 (+),score=27.59 TRINITY_DN4097_c0_g1_i1:56-757(+)
MTVAEQLLVVSVVASAVTFFSGKWRPYLGSWLVKGLSTISLGILCLMSEGDWTKSTFGAGMLAHALGDILLELGASAGFAQARNVGIIFFLLGHIIYLGVFAFNVPFAEALAKGAHVMPLLIIIVAISAYFILYVQYTSHHKVLRVVISIYIVALACMAISGVINDLHYEGKVSWTSAGVLLYLLSDGFIGYSMFGIFATAKSGNSRRIVGVCVWPLYYAGQIVLATTIASRP